MKRTLSLLLAAVLLLTALTACGGKTAFTPQPLPMPATDEPSTYEPTAEPEPDPEPTPEPAPTPEPTPTPRPDWLDYEFDTTSNYVDTNAGYDYYFQYGTGLMRRDPTTNKEETAIVLDNGQNIKQLAVFGSMETYGEALGDSGSGLGWYQAEIDKVKDQVDNATYISLKVERGADPTPIFYSRTYIGTFSTPDSQVSGEQTGVRVGTSWARLQDREGKPVVFWMGTAPQQGTEDVAKWADLLTDSVALRSVEWRTAMQSGVPYPDVEENYQYCVLARDPSGENWRVLWSELDTRPVLDAIIQDKLLYHTVDDSNVYTNMVYDLTTGEQRPNYAVPTGLIGGFTPTTAYTQRNGMWLTFTPVAMDYNQL